LVCAHDRATSILGAVLDESGIGSFDENSGAGAREQSWAVVGSKSSAVLVAGAGVEVELSVWVEAGTLVWVSDAHEWCIAVGADLVAGAIGQEEVGAVVRAGEARREPDDREGADRHGEVCPFAH
jgi:hypothetical protein